MKRSTYYLLSFTWGIIVSAIGVIYSIALLLIGRRPKRFGHCVRFEIGRNWGGLNLGWLIITNKNPSRRLLEHEHGHGVQNIMLGPLMPFLVCIPSSLRYHGRNIIKRLRPKTKLKPYDSIWFEGWATRLGADFCKDK